MEKQTDEGQPRKESSMETQTQNSHWLLCSSINIIQAALLILNIDPSSEEARSIKEELPHKRPEGYDAVRTALINDILSQKLKAHIVYPVSPFSEEFNTDRPDCGLTTINVQDLRDWLISHGILTGFFFPNASDDRPDYLDPNHPRFAPKLAAAIRAWQAMEDKTRLKGKTPKQGIEKWLRENAAQFALTKDDGNPNNDAIEQLAKVANWEPGGGAPKTPSSKPAHPSKAQKK